MSKAQAERVINLLAERGESLAISEIESRVNIRRGRLEAMLKILEVDGAVGRSASKWLRTLRPWSYDEDRYRAITALRRNEQQAMIDYAATSQCLMAFLPRQLDDESVQPCGPMCELSSRHSAVNARGGESLRSKRVSKDALDPACPSKAMAS